MRASFSTGVRVLGAVFMLCMSGALANSPFAALTVVPAGGQVFDIISGITTLPQGGTVTDQDTGVALVAGHIEYRAQDYLEASRVSLDGSFGHVTADVMRIDLKVGLLTASGGLRLVREGLSVSADSLNFDANAQVATFAGGVQSSDPSFVADRVLLDVASGDVLLEGEYVFEGGVFALRSPEGGGLLALKLVVSDGVTSYDAATEVAPEVLARFAPYL